jgi:pimeloyl-ACP methyl ester carboxylesterase
METITVPSCKGNGKSIYANYYSGIEKSKNCIIYACSMFQYPDMNSSFLEELSKDFDVIAPHYTGHGINDQEVDFTFDDLVDDVKSAILFAEERYGYENIILFGFSLGGIISAIIAPEEGLPLKAIFAMEVALAEMPETYKYVFKVPFLKKRERILAVADFLEKIVGMIERTIRRKIKFSEKLFRNKRIASKSDLEASANFPFATKGYRKEFLLSFLRAKTDEIVTKGSKYPFVMIASKSDRLIPFGYQQMVSKKINADEFIELNIGGEHCSMQPHKVLEVVVPKLKKYFNQAL